MTDKKSIDAVKVVLNDLPMLLQGKETYFIRMKTSKIVMDPIRVERKARISIIYGIKNIISAIKQWLKKTFVIPGISLPFTETIVESYYDLDEKTGKLKKVKNPKTPCNCLMSLEKEVLKK